MKITAKVAPKTTIPSSLRDYVHRNGGSLYQDESEDYLLDSLRFRTFPGRDGYDEDFLGARVALPLMNESLRAQAAPRVVNPEKVELEYTPLSSTRS